MKMNAGIWIGLAGGLIGIIVAIVSVLSVGGSSGIYIAAGIVVVFGGDHKTQKEFLVKRTVRQVWPFTKISIS